MISARHIHVPHELGEFYFKKMLADISRLRFIDDADTLLRASRVVSTPRRFS